MAVIRSSFEILTENIVDYHTRLTGPWDLQATQITPGGFTSVHRGFTDSRSLIYEETFRGGVAIDCALAPGFVAFSLPNVTARSGKWWGKPFPENQIAFSTGGREIAVQLPAGYGNLIAILPVEDFRTDFELETGTQPDFLDGQGHYLSLPPGALGQLAGDWQEFIRPPADSMMLRHGTSLCREITRSLAAALPLPPSSFSSTAVGRHHVRRMIEICNDLNGQIDLDGVCQSLNVSRRSLEVHVLTHLGVTPHRYLRLKRLNQAYEALLRADPGTSLVKEIAANHSFLQIGRFSVEYRRLFGEMPSETLRRAALDRSQGPAIELRRLT